MKILIVDDEALARNRVRKMLESVDSVRIVGECRDGVEAVEAICNLAPDVVLLDVQMPEMNGFDVLRSLETVRTQQADDAETLVMPLVVFITAFDQYAIDAFTANAVDYLLKPFERERFYAMLERTRQRLEQERLSSIKRDLLALADKISPAPPVSSARQTERFVVKEKGKFITLEARDIEWIESVGGNYVTLHTTRGSHYLRQTLSNLETKLLPHHFLRIHRSTIVQIDAVHEIHPSYDDNPRVVMQSGAELPIGRIYHADVIAKLRRRGL